MKKLQILLPLIIIVVILSACKSTPAPSGPDIVNVPPATAKSQASTETDDQLPPTAPAGKSPSTPLPPTPGPASASTTPLSTIDSAPGYPAPGEPTAASEVPAAETPVTEAPAGDTPTVKPTQAPTQSNNVPGYPVPGNPTPTNAVPGYPVPGDSTPNNPTPQPSPPTPQPNPPTPSPTASPTPNQPSPPTPAQTLPPTPAKTSTPTPTQPAPPTLTRTPTPTSTDPAAGVDGFPNPQAYRWERIGTDFGRPLLVTNAGDGSDRLFVVLQIGLIYVVEDGQRINTPFLDIRHLINATDNEQGLLGLAFHPDHAENGLFYINYTNLNGDTNISEFKVGPNPSRALPESERILLNVFQPYTNHNGGHLAFGPDGYLYASLGDGGFAGDPEGNGQNTNTLLGSILRLDVSEVPYGIPTDNPFASGGGRPEIWAYGLRNPWRFSFDAKTGDLFIGDVGQNTWEEVNFLPTDAEPGANFGWAYREGDHGFKGTPPNLNSLIPPVWEYSHAEGCSITGGYVYRGAMSEWHGIYLYGDYCMGTVWGLRQTVTGEWKNQLLFQTGFNISSFGTDESGELYMVDRGGGIYKLVPQ